MERAVVGWSSEPGELECCQEEPATLVEHAYCSENPRSLDTERQAAGSSPAPHVSFAVVRRSLRLTILLGVLESLPAGGLEVGEKADPPRLSCLLRLASERRRQRPKRQPAEECAPVHHTSATASPISRMRTSMEDGCRGV